jgi:hypothetical protein
VCFLHCMPLRCFDKGRVNEQACAKVVREIFGAYSPRSLDF